MYKYDKEVSLKELEGKVISSVVGLEKESESVIINTVCGKVYEFYHEQDCCEHVTLNDFEGDAGDLVGGVVVTAEEISGEVPVNTNEYQESETWTFYKIETNKGGLWMRWLGESNGYYSEEVSFVQLK